MKTIFTVAAFIVCIGIVLCAFYKAIDFLGEGIIWIKELITHKDKKWRKFCIGQIVACLAVGVFWTAIGIMILTVPFVVLPHILA